MAQEIVVFCDLHLTRHDVRVIGTAYEIAVSGYSGPTLVDLCEDCAAPLSAVLGILLDVGRRPRGAKSNHVVSRTPSAEFECDICSYQSVSPQGIAMHRAKSHGIPGRKRAEEAAAALVRVGQLGEAEGGYRCPDCDFVAQARAGLHSHRRSRHRELAGAK